MTKTTPDLQIYGRPDCRFTIDAAKLAEDNEEQFGRMQLLHKSEMPKRLSVLVPESHKTVPIIFINDKFIGGFTEFKAFVFNGR